MFDRNRFISDCRKAAEEGVNAVREIVKETVSDWKHGGSADEELTRPGITTLYRSSGLTIIHYAWPPFASLLPHNHNMFAVIGVYSGREENIFWQKTAAAIKAAGAESLGPGDVTVLGKDVIHSVFNPIDKTAGALHVYGGDIFTPETPRSEWDHETLTERPWNGDGILSIFSKEKK